MVTGLETITFTDPINLDRCYICRKGCIRSSIVYGEFDEDFVITKPAMVLNYARLRRLCTSGVMRIY